MCAYAKESAIRQGVLAHRKQGKNLEQEWNK
jgi:hypothetical protein